MTITFMHLYTSHIRIRIGNVFIHIVIFIF